MGKSDVIKREFARNLKQMTTEQALATVTISALCTKTGLSRSTFYYHFIDLYDLMEWILDTELFLPLQNYLYTHKVGDWAYATRMSLEKMLDDRDFYCQLVRLDVQNSPQDFMRQRNRDSWVVLLKRYMEETKQQYDAETLDFLTTFIAQAISNMTIDWAKDGMKTPIDQMCKMNEVAIMGIYGIINKANKDEKGTVSQKK